jgi:glucose-6-phosphate 1-epimerase
LVDDINHVKLNGLDTPFDDKLTSTINNSALSNYRLVQEVDRIHGFQHAQYSNIQTIHIVNDNRDSQASMHSIEQSGHDSTVVWNPWIDKSKSMDDMENDGYKTMLCIEAANTVNAQHPLILAPHQSHRLSQKIL